MRRRYVFIDEGSTTGGGGGGGGGKTVNISLNGVAWQPPVTMPAGWQEYRVNATGQQSGFLKYSDDTTSNYKIELMNGDPPITGRNDGKTTGNNSGIIPDGPLTNSCANTSTSYTSYRLSGLNNSLTYTILLVGSYSNAWNWYTWYKIGTDERSLKTDNNTTTGVTYTGISPSSGNIDIYWKDSGSGWGLINGMVITESS